MSMKCIADPKVYGQTLEPVYSMCDFFVPLDGLTVGVSVFIGQHLRRCGYPAAKVEVSSFFLPTLRPSRHSRLRELVGKLACSARLLI